LRKLLRLQFDFELAFCRAQQCFQTRDCVAICSIPIFIRGDTLCASDIGFTVDCALDDCPELYRFFLAASPAVSSPCRCKNCFAKLVIV
jgi:hypothetical protein